MPLRITRLGTRVASILGLTLLIASGCAPASTPPVGEGLGSVTNEALLNVFLEETTGTALPGGARDAAVELPTDGVPKVYDLTPGAEHWFILDEQAAYLGLHYSGAVDPEAYLVNQQDERVKMPNLSGDGQFESPDSCSTAVDPVTGSGLPDAAWLVIIPETYQDVPARVAIVASTEF